MSNPLPKKIEEHRLAIERDRLELEKSKAEFDRKFFNRNLAVIITAIVSLAAVAVSWIQWTGVRAQKDREIYLSELQQNREWNISMATFVSEHKDDIFGGDEKQRKRIQEVILVTFPANITSILFQKLGETATSDEAKKTWQDAQKTIPYNRDVMVWVNTGSGVYHCPGSQWYENTSRGVLMRQEEALAKGNRPAYDNPCQ